jgi:predicted NBD/HSP70 family sugar kinase
VYPAPDDILEIMSANAVLRTILRHGPVARSTVARLAGISPAGVTRLTASLAELGLITETAGPIARNGMGRPHIPVDIDTGRHTVGGVHIAHDHCTLAVLDLAGNVRAQERIPHTSTDPPTLLTAIGDRLRVFLAEYRPLALGVATGGWVDADEGVIVEHASLGWRDVPVRDLLMRSTGLTVHVDSHARALAQAEQLFGEVSQNVVHLFVGNVVDAAIVTDGKPHRGPRSAAGEIAHLPLGPADIRCELGHRGCFEASASDRTWAQRAVDEGIIESQSMWDLVASRDDRARALFVERARLVGRAAALLFDLVNPEVLVVTEAGVLHFPESLEAVRAEVAVRSRVCADPWQAIVASSFSGESVLAVAGAAVGLDVLYSDPLSLARKRVPVRGLT